MTTGLVGQNQIAPFTSPIPGGSLDATVVLGNDNSTVTSYDAHDNDSTIHFQSSTLANRPPASTAGQKWLTTDAAARYIYYDSGSAWVEVNYFRDSGGIITGAVTISDTTESTSTTTGALIVSGGVGIAKNVFIGGTLGVTGVATFTAKPIVSTLTASQAVFSDSVKGLVSNALTGTGNVVMSASPTLTGTIGAASMTLSGTLGVTGVATFTAQPIVSSLTASKPVFTDASKGLVSTGTLDTTQGGTNLTTYTTGDILYASATNVLSKLPIGTTGQHLIVTAGLPAWGTDTALGTVTSVSFTGGLISVATATTTPALTVAGTSGGVVYFSSASTWASSAALTASALVLGGGAGAAPATTTTGTGVVTALGVNVGTAGAFVVNGGALGTPSSGAVAASLITAGTFGAGAYTFSSTVSMGALTATTGAFTKATYGDVITFTNGGSTPKTGYLYSDPDYVGFFGGAGATGDGILMNVTSHNLYLKTNNGTRLTIDSAGAATFSSSVSMGALTATTGTFSGKITSTVGNNAIFFDSVSATTGYQSTQIKNTGAWMILGIEGSTASSLVTNDTAYSTVLVTQNATDLILGTNQTMNLKIASGGAATFSSTVTLLSASPTLVIKDSTASVTGGIYGTLEWRSSDGSMPASGVAGRIDTYDDGGLYGDRSAMRFYVNNSTSLYKWLEVSSAGAATFSSTVTAATVYSTTVGATNRDLYIDSTGLMGYVSSIRASKTNITPLTDTAWLDALTPVAFNYRKKDEDGAYTDEANTPLEYGLIAEDVEGVNAELVFYDETEDGLALRGVSYNKLMIPLLQRVQALTARVAALEAV